MQEWGIMETTKNIVEEGVLHGAKCCRQFAANED